MIAKLNDALAGVEIREPFKTYFKPTFLFQESCHWHEGIRLSVYIDTIDAKYGGILPRLESNYDLTPYLVDRFLRKPKDLAKFLHKCLSETLIHEVSESLFFNGEPAVQPEHWGPDISGSQISFPVGESIK